MLSGTRCSCIAILLVSLVSFAAITLCVASQPAFIVISVYFVMDSVRKLLDIPSYALLYQGSSKKICIPKIIQINLIMILQA
jgi:hypothetical protein